MDWTLFRDEFPFTKGKPVFLNTGSSGLKPAEVYAAADGYRAIVEAHGPCGVAFEAAIHPLVRETRELAAALVGADEGCAALCLNTSHALSVAAHALRWSPGERVLVARSEYISGHLACQLLAERFGVEIVPFDHAADHSFDLPAFARALETPGIRLALVSHVNYNTGETLPVAEICRLCRARGAVSLVDGAQAAGRMPVDVKALACDLYVYPAHKWLCGIEGAGALVARKELLPALLPLEIGYDSVARYRPDEPLSLHPDGRRFEFASPAYPSLLSFRAALLRARRIGVDAIAARAGELATRFWRGASTRDHLLPVTPAHARNASPLASFHVAGVPAQQAAAALLSRGIIVRPIPHPSCIRASFHVYNTEQEVDALLRALDEICG